MQNKKSTLVAHFWLILASGLMIAPLLGMVLTSFKTPEQIAASPYSWWPHPWRWQNYVEAMQTIPFVQYLLNSLVLCFGSVMGTLVSCSLVAYSFARLRWPGRDLMFAVLIATMLLPWQVTMVPRFLIIRELGLYDSLGALIVPKFLGEAFYIFLLRQFFLTIPAEIMAACRPVIVTMSG